MIVDNGGGKYTIVDSEGQTRVVDQKTANSESAKTGIKIISSGQTGATGYGLNTTGNFPGSQTTQGQGQTVSIDGKTVTLADAINQAYGAKKLGEIRANLLKYGQLTKAEARDPNNLMQKWSQIVFGAANDPDPANRNPYEYAKSLQKQGFVSTFGTGAGPMTYTQYSAPSVTAISKTLDAISADLLGRQLSPEEKAKYFAMLQAEEKKPTSASVTKVTPMGTGAQVSRTSGGLDEQQFLIEKLAATDEAKAQKVLNAYDTVSKMLGGLQ